MTISNFLPRCAAYLSSRLFHSKFKSTTHSASGRSFAQTTFFIKYRPTAGRIGVFHTLERVPAGYTRIVHQYTRIAASHVEEH